MLSERGGRDVNKEAFRCLKRHLVRVVRRALREPAVVAAS